MNRDINTDIAEALDLLVDETTSAWGQEFFNKLVKSLGMAFDMDHVLISAKTDDELITAKCYALWADGQLGEPFNYALKDSACLRVLSEGSTLRCLRDANREFARNPYIVNMPAQCYLGVPIKNPKGETIGLVATLDRKPLQDSKRIERFISLFSARISADLQRDKVEAKLVKLALEDSLTKLPNRHALMQELNNICQPEEMSGSQKHAVLFIDCDRFKMINDQWGHLFGDRVLLEVTARLTSLLAENAMLARFGGDEFVIVLKNIENRNDAINLAEKINLVLEDPIRLDNHTMTISSSIGVVFSGSKHAYTPDLLLRNADIAMYKAKATGRARFEIFEEADFESVQQKITQEAALKKAILKKEFRVRYQPIINIKSSNIVGLEALVTWQTENGELVYPDGFIPLAEETNLMADIDQIMLAQAVPQFKAWQEDQLLSANAYLSVNYCAEHLLDFAKIATLHRTLEEHEFDGANLNIEVTETSVMVNGELCQFVLDRFKSRKIKLSIDDFGTGYSSLSYLHEFPFTHLKIDRSFIVDIVTDNKRFEVVKTIISLARNLGLCTIAEGVETQEQLDILTQLGCDNVQGFYFAKPLFAEQMECLFNEYQPVE